MVDYQSPHSVVGIVSGVRESQVQIPAVTYKLGDLGKLLYMTEPSLTK